MNICTLLYLKWITNKDLLYSRWNSAQCYVAAWMRGRFGGECARVCVAEPLAAHLSLSQHYSSTLLLSSLQWRLTLCDRVYCSIPGPPFPHHLPEFVWFSLVMPSNHLTLCHPLLPAPSIFPSIRAFSNELALVRCVSAKRWRTWGSQPERYLRKKCTRQKWQSKLKGFRLGAHLTHSGS